MKLLCGLLLLVTHSAFACINVDTRLKGVSIEGAYKVAEDEAPIGNLRSQMARQPSDKANELREHLKTMPYAGTEAPLGQAAEEVDAVIDILTGNYDRAIEKLIAIEKDHPGVYSTAANLGTAYELAGHNREALHWITEGLKRDEYSHQATEWLHKKILEAKIEMESDPAYLLDHHILPLSETELRGRNFTFKYDGSTMTTYALQKSLRYQLVERLLFVKPEDAVVADLLYSYAILEANTMVLDTAVELLKMARGYGYHDLADIDSRIARYERTIDSTQRSELLKGIGAGSVWVVVLLLALLALRYLFRLVRRRRT